MSDCSENFLYLSYRGTHFSTAETFERILSRLACLFLPEIYDMPWPPNEQVQHSVMLQQRINIYQARLIYLYLSFLAVCVCLEGELYVAADGSKTHYYIYCGSLLWFRWSLYCHTFQLCRIFCSFLLNIRLLFNLIVGLVYLPRKANVWDWHDDRI